nr:nitroreductase family protein [Prevotella koreensis]
MITKDKVTEVFCIIDEFDKNLNVELSKNKFLSSSVLKFLLNSSIIQKFSVILSSVIIADFVCILLIYNTIRVQQYLQITKFNDEFYPELANKIMTIQEAIEARHSVRAYKEKPLTEDVVKVLEEQIAVLNREGNLHIQLILNEPKAFQGTMAKYGKFCNANNYIVMAGKKADDLDERVGYFGEHLVLLAQTLGLNTCWVGLSYSKVPGTYVLDEGEKIACYIAIGYGETQGVGHKIKTTEQVSNASDIIPSWFKNGVEAALLAPTAVNQQKFSFEYIGMENNRHKIHAKRGFSIIGYTKMDLGIAKYHFEIGAGKENFVWV